MALWPKNIIMVAGVNTVRVNGNFSRNLRAARRYDSTMEDNVRFNLSHRVARCVQRWNEVVPISRSLVVLAVRLLCKRTIKERVMKELLHRDYPKEVRNTTQQCR